MTEALGDLIKRLREQKGYRSCRSFAKAVEKSTTFIWLVEQGRAVPGIETLEKISILLGHREEIFRAADKIQPEIESLLKEPGMACLLQQIREMSPLEREELLKKQGVSDEV